MSMTITDVNGKVHKIEDIDKIKWVDYKGDTVYEGDYGDTVTYQQGGETKTKKISETRRLLKFMDGFAAGDYSYMPKTTADIVQATSLEMMTDSTGWTVAKAGTVLAGGLIGGFVGSAAGAMLGASIGSIVANMGADTIWLASSYNEDPNTFWTKYLNGLKDIARGADSDKEPNATGWRRWLSEINTGASYVGMGGKAALHETWDDIIGATPDYVSMNIVGNLTRSIAAGIGGTPTYVIDQALNDGIREGARITGVTNDVAQAVGLGAVYAGVAGGTAWGFTKLALANKGMFKKLADVSPFLGEPVANAAEAVGAQLSYDVIQDVIDPTEEKKSLADYGINAAMALAMGYTMSALPKMWKKAKTEEVAKTPNVPDDSGVSVKEAVEGTVVITPDEQKIIDAQIAEYGQEYMTPSGTKRFNELQGLYDSAAVPRTSTEPQVKVGKVGGTEYRTIKTSEERPELPRFKPWKNEVVKVADDNGNVVFEGAIYRNDEGEVLNPALWLRELHEKDQKEFFEAYKAGEIAKQERADFEDVLSAITEYKGEIQNEADIAAYKQRLEQGRKYKAEYKAKSSAEREARNKIAQLESLNRPLSRQEKLEKIRLEKEADDLAKVHAERQKSIDYYGDNYKEWYSDYSARMENNIMRGLGYGALGDDFVNTAAREMRRDAMGAAYAELTEAQRNAFAQRIGFADFEEFIGKTPIIDLLEWNEKLIDIYDIPVYNPNVLSISPQQRTNIMQDSLRRINNGMQPEIAVYQSFAAATRHAPDRAQVGRILDDMPSTIRLMKDNRDKLWNAIDFMDDRAQKYIKGEAEFTYKLPEGEMIEDVQESISKARTLKDRIRTEKPVETKPIKISKSDMINVFGTETISKDGWLISKNQDVVMKNGDRGFTYAEDVKRAQTSAIEGIEETTIKKYEELFDKVEKSPKNVAQKGEVSSAGSTNYQEFLISGGRRFVRKNKWDMIEKKFGKELELWTSTTDPNLLFFKDGDKMGFVTFDAKRAVKEPEPPKAKKGKKK